MDNYSLSFSVLLRAIHCAQEGEWAQIRELGLTPEDIHVLGKLTLGELTQLKRTMPSHILKVEVDRLSLYAVLDSARQAQERHALKFEFLRRDAPADMMEKLFGMGPKAYTRYRAIAKAPQAQGRPAEPNEAVSSQVWHAWIRYPGTPAQDLQHWLKVADATGQSLRVVWALIQHWTECSILPDPSSQEPSKPPELRLKDKDSIEQAAR